MLNRLCFKLSTKRIFSILGVIYILPIPMMCPLPLSPKVTILLDSRVINYFLSCVMSLEQPLSKYHILFFSLAIRHTYKQKSSSDFRYSGYLGSFRISRNGSFENPNLFQNFDHFSFFWIHNCRLCVQFYHNRNKQSYVKKMMILS